MTMTDQPAAGQPPPAPPPGPGDAPGLGEIGVPDGSLARGAATLAELYELLTTADQLIARAVVLAGRAQAQGAAEEHCGVDLGLWLGVVARRTGADRKTLLNAADTLAGMPHTAEAFAAGRLSWGQIRAITRAVAELDTAARGQVDAAIADELEVFERAEADELVWRVDELALAHAPQPVERAERRERDHRFVWLQPRLDGSGGRGYFELGADQFAVVAEALDAGQPAPGGGSAGGGRAAGARGGAKRRRATAAPPQAARRDPRRPGPAREPRARGRARADRLVELCRAGLAGGGDGASARPLVLLTMDVDTLLDRSRLPATLLTRLTGGQLRVSATTARRLVTEGGCDLRTVLLEDTGQVLGVGRRQRLAPDWLAEALTARDPVCSFPGCKAPARICDTDHAPDWDAGGRTDADHLAPVCRRHHTPKTNGHWQVTQRRDGTRVWRHTHTGFTASKPPGAKQLAA